MVQHQHPFARHLHRDWVRPAICAFASLISRKDTLLSRGAKHAVGDCSATDEVTVALSPSKNGAG